MYQVRNITGTLQNLRSLEESYIADTKTKLNSPSLDQKLHLSYLSPWGENLGLLNHYLIGIISYALIIHTSKPHNNAHCVF